MRVPSANLSWTDVDGKLSSTTRPRDGVGAVLRGVDEVVGSEANGAELLPRVLPTP